MSAERLAEIQARCEAATPGPWVMRRPHDEDEDHEHIDGPDGSPIAMGHVGEDIGADAEFIANAREDVPFLLAKLTASEAEVARLRKLFDDAGQGEHNVLALVEHYQREALASEAAVKALHEVIGRPLRDGLTHAECALDSLRDLVADHKDKTAERDEALAKLAASEAAAGQMRAVLELLKEVFDDWRPAAPSDSELRKFLKADRAVAAALTTDAGKSWMSPEEVERLRKELAELKHALSLAPTLQDLAGFVSEEECDRRCREVAREVVRAMTGSELMADANTKSEFVDPIVERVAKGGAR